MPLSIKLRSLLEVHSLWYAPRVTSRLIDICEDLDQLSYKGHKVIDMH